MPLCNTAFASPSSSKTRSAPCAVKSARVPGAAAADTLRVAHVFQEAAQKAGLWPQKKEAGLLQPRPDSDGPPQRASPNRLADVWIPYWNDMITRSLGFCRYLMPPPSETEPRPTSSSTQHLVKRMSHDNRCHQNGVCFTPVVLRHAERRSRGDSARSFLRRGRLASSRETPSTTHSPNDWCPFAFSFSSLPRPSFSCATCFCRHSVVSGLSVRVSNHLVSKGLMLASTCSSTSSSWSTESELPNTVNGENVFLNAAFSLRQWWDTA